MEEKCVLQEANSAVWTLRTKVFFVQPKGKDGERPKRTKCNQWKKRGRESGRKKDELIRTVCLPWPNMTLDCPPFPNGTRVEHGTKGRKLSEGVQSLSQDWKQITPSRPLKIVSFLLHSRSLKLLKSLKLYLDPKIGSNKTIAYILDLCSASKFYDTQTRLRAHLHILHPRHIPQFVLSVLFLLFLSGLCQFSDFETDKGKQKKPWLKWQSENVLW